MISIRAERAVASIRLPARGYFVLATAIFCSIFPGLGHSASAGDLDAISSFDIPAESLDKALLQFGAQAHLQIMFAWHSKLGRLQTERLQGSLTGRQALAELLQGMPLQFVEHDGTVRVVPRQGSAARDATPPSNPDPQSSDVSAENSPPTKPVTNTSLAHVKLQTVTVTGTHIAGAQLSSPLITLTSEEISQSGYSTTGDLIRSLPENFGGGNNPSVMNGSAPGADNASFSGGSTPNLRGLGSGSTLTLVDGHRLAADTPTGAVDISMIPIAAIDHIDVLTDGASAVYGSDAVAGVVNVVLKQDFSGSKTTVLGAGTTDGGATERDFNEMAGKTWSSGGVILDYELDKLTPVYSTQREYSLAAASPTMLLPGMSRNSLFLSAHQMLSDDISGFFDGLYTYRIARDDISNYIAPVVYQGLTEAGVHQYAAAIGINAALPAAWQLSAVASSSEDRTLYQSTEQPGGPFPPIALEGQARYVEATANGPALSLPSGTVRSAIGGGYRLEAYSEDEGGLPQVSDTQRDVKYVYGETTVPLLPSSEDAWRHALVLDASGRYEKYSDVGGESVPKIGLVYEPFQTVKFRGTWGKAFRAPPLYDLFESTNLLYLPLEDPRSATGVTDSLVDVGGNPALKPERATTWTLGLDYDSQMLPGLVTSLTYFNVIYRDRISQIANFFTALTDPLNSPFVTRSPSPAVVQGLINDAGPNIINDTGAPIEAGDVPVLVNNEWVNIANQNIDGLDLSVKYHKSTRLADIEPFLNGSLLDLRQQLTPQQPEVEISGQAFEPAKFRARGGAALIHGPWTVTSTLNFTGSEINTYQPTQPHVSSWTTVDFDLMLRPQLRAVLSDLTLNLSVENAFNRAPPFVEFDQYVPGVFYDPTNANVLGRVIRLSGSWEFE